MKQIGADREKVKLNVARMKSSGETFEVVVDPDKAMLFRKGGISDIGDVLQSEHIFDDAKKGLLTAESRLQDVFGTKDAAAVAKRIILEGDIQLTEEYRNSLREEKRRKIIDLIHRNAIDPTNGHPIPATRIENAIAEAKARIDETRSAEDQIQDILHKLKPIMPIKFDTKRIEVRIPQRYAKHAFGILKRYGTVSRNEWSHDGAVRFLIEIPAGMQDEFYDTLNKETHGSSETRVEK